MDPRYALARRTEIAAWTELYRAVPAAFRRAQGVHVERVGDATLLLVAGVPHPLLNRAWVPLAEPERLAAVARRFRELGAQRYFVHTQAQPGQVPERLATSAGLALYRRHWVKMVGRLGRGERAPAPRCELPIEPAAPGEAGHCARLFCAGFDIPMRAAPLFTAAPGRAGWRGFVARAASGELAGVGYLFARDRVAYLAGATTAREHRRCGVQQGLLHARVRAAAAAGCEWIASETGESVGGDPQHSQHNMEWAGLQVVGRTVNLGPDGMRWSHGLGAPRERRA